MTIDFIRTWMRVRMKMLFSLTKQSKWLIDFANENMPFFILCKNAFEYDCHTMVPPPRTLNDIPSFLFTEQLV
jgi:hypothetical protein